MNQTTRIVVVDDHRMLREAIVKFLSSKADFEVVGEAEDGSHALELIEQHHPDILLLDLSIKGLDSFEVLRLLRLMSIDMDTIVLSMHADHEYVGRAIAHGVRGYVLKEEALDDLVAAIQKVRAGERFFSPKLHCSQSSQAQLGQSPLSQKEIDILTLIASGLNTREIAEQLNRSSKTVETHRARISQKLGLRNVAEFTRYAIRHGYSKI